MNRLDKIYEEVIKQLEEDAIVADTPAPATGDPIEVDAKKPGEEEDDITANSKGVGTKDVLGDFDPNAGIGTRKDNYIPTKFRKKKKDEVDPKDLAPLPKTVPVDTAQGELLKAAKEEDKKAKK